MQRRADFLVAYAAAHGPVTVRQLYYRAEVDSLPGIDKTERSYGKIQRQMLLRRAKVLPYRDIADLTRWMRKPASFDNVEEALSGVKGDNSIKIFGPDIDKLELLAEKARHILQGIQGVANVGIFHVRGATHLQFRVDPFKCQKWGVTESVVGRALMAPPGVPVASLVARGDADLGFQQLSELIGQPGIEILGPLPPEIQAVTIFSAGLSSASHELEAARAVVAYITSAETGDTKRRYGMEPA